MRRGLEAAPIPYAKNIVAIRGRTSLSQEWGAFIQRFPWRFFVTLTHKRYVDANELMKLFTDKYVRRLTRITQAPVHYFVVIEAGQDKKEHVHALMFGEGRLDGGFSEAPLGIREG